MNIGANEQGGTVTFLFYLVDHPGQYDKIDVHVIPGSKNSEVRKGTSPVIKNAYDGSYTGFQNYSENLIKTCPQNGSVNISTTKWVSFGKSVLDTWATRPDVTVTITYKYQNQTRNMTIPAGSNVPGMRDKNGYVGFNYLYGAFQN